MDPTTRPTTEVADVLLLSMDRMYDAFVARLEGLSAEEFLWEPVGGMWSVRDVDGVAVVDGAGVRQIDPPPVTTIAWRTWHIAIDCFDDYTRRFAGDDSDAPNTWTVDPGDAIVAIDRSWTAYRSVISSRDFFDTLGSDWEHWSNSCVADMAMHASNEMVHHAAEIALLRDLYRDRAS